LLGFLDFRFLCTVADDITISLDTVRLERGPESWTGLSHSDFATSIPRIVLTDHKTINMLLCKSHLARLLKKAAQIKITEFASLRNFEVAISFRF
jgi:hypothetical protein